MDVVCGPGNLYTVGTQATPSVLHVNIVPVLFYRVSFQFFKLVVVHAKTYALLLFEKKPPKFVIYSPVITYIEYRPPKHTLKNGTQQQQ